MFSRRHYAIEGPRAQSRRDEWSQALERAALGAPKFGTAKNDKSNAKNGDFHKLPTSCRLTATPRCCACLDKRPHATSYSKYIDG